MLVLGYAPAPPPPSPRVKPRPNFHFSLNQIFRTPAVAAALARDKTMVLMLDGSSEYGAHA